MTAHLLLQMWLKGEVGTGGSGERICREDKALSKGSHKVYKQGQTTGRGEISVTLWRIWAVALLETIQSVVTGAVMHLYYNLATESHYSFNNQHEFQKYTE